MQGIPFAVKFFDDDKNFYMSPSLYESIGVGNNVDIRYVILSWRTDQITLEQAIADIRERVVKYGLETEQILEGGE